MLLITELMGVCIFFCPHSFVTTPHIGVQHITLTLGITWVLQIPKPNCLGNLYMSLLCKTSTMVLKFKKNVANLFGRVLCILVHTQNFPDTIPNHYG